MIADAAPRSDGLSYEEWRNEAPLNYEIVARYEFQDEFGIVRHFLGGTSSVPSQETYKVLWLGSRGTFSRHDGA